MRVILYIDRLEVSYASVPKPSTWALLAVGLGALLLSRPRCLRLVTRQNSFGDSPQHAGGIWVIVARSAKVLG
jgi:hypothetical protein